MQGPKDKPKRVYRAPAVRELVADTPVGQCIFCQEPLPGNARAGQICCGTVECLTDYDRANRSGARGKRRSVENRADFARAMDLMRQAMALMFRVQRRVAAVEGSRNSDG